MLNCEYLVNVIAPSSSNRKSASGNTHHAEILIVGSTHGMQQHGILFCAFARGKKKHLVCIGSASLRNSQSQS